jgi:hypothetical protein
MKKLLLTITALGLTASALLAQTVNVPAEHKNIVVKEKTYLKNGKRLSPAGRGADDVSTWYNYTLSYEEDALLGTKLSAFVSFIYPDTTGYIVYADSSKVKSGFHVVGSCFDPKDSTFLATGEKVLTKFNPYTLDSLQWTQFYVRQLDSVNLGAGKVAVVDTVFIQYFNATGLDISAYVYQGQTARHWWGRPTEANYSAKTLLNSKAVKTDTLLLTADWADSVALNGPNTTFFGRPVQNYVGLKAGTVSTAAITNNVVAWSMVFKPMVKTKLGDTLIAYNGANWTKKYNMFGVRLASLANHDQNLPYNTRINNSFITNFEVRYGQTVSIFKSYLSGTIFGNSIFLPHYAHITTSNLSDNSIAENMISGAVVYPNPAAVDASVDVVFNLGSASAVAARIVDMNGREIKAFDSKTFGVGQQVLNLSTEGLSKGMYMVVLESTSGKATSMLNIQ